MINSYITSSIIGISSVIVGSYGLYSYLNQKDIVQIFGNQIVRKNNFSKSIAEYISKGKNSGAPICHFWMIKKDESNQEITVRLGQQESNDTEEEKLQAKKDCERIIKEMWTSRGKEQPEEWLRVDKERFSDIESEYDFLSSYKELNYSDSTETTKENKNEWK